MTDARKEIEELREQIAALTQRIYRLERAAKLVEEHTSAAPLVTEAEPARPYIPPPPPPPRPVLKTRTQSAAASADLESRIGSQWLNRVGVVAVLVGASYFLKYAFDSQWIGPAAQVVIMLLAGGAVIAWSTRFVRRGHRTFALSLKALGVGILYLAFWAAFQVHDLLPAPAAFAGMVVVTVGTATAAVRQNSQMLAAMALVGGFATPLLLSTGENRPVELFTYTALLDAAVLVLVMKRPWPGLLFGSFAATLLLYVGWVVGHYTEPQLGIALSFASVFFLLFASAPVLAQLAGQAGLSLGSAVLLTVTLLNGVVYFFQSWGLLGDDDRSRDLGVLLSLVAGFYVVLSMLLRRLDASDTQLARANTALAAAFAAAAVPFLLSGWLVTLVYLLGTALLFHLGHATESRWVQGYAAVLMVLALLRLVTLDRFDPERLLLNTRAALYGIAIAVLAYAAYRLRAAGPGARDWGAACVVLVNLLALVALTLEISDYYARRMSAEAALAGMERLRWVDRQYFATLRDFTYSALWVSYGAGLMAAGFAWRSAFLRWQALLLIAISVVKVFLYDVSRLQTGYRIVSFIALGIVLLAISFAYQKDWLGLVPAKKGEPSL